MFNDLLALWVVFAVCVTSVCALTFLYVVCKLSGLESLMGAAQDAVDAVSVQLGKAKAEIVSKIADLETQVANGETPDLTALKAAAQSLDDVVPDPVVEEPPVENPPVEEPPVGDTPAEPTE